MSSAGNSNCRQSNVVRGRTHPLSDPLQIGIRFLPHPFPAASSASFAVRLPSRGGNGVTSFISSITPGFRSCLSAGGAPSATGEWRAPVPDHIPFWFKPDSIFGLSLVTAFISTSPGLTCPGLLAPDRRDAGSRRVGSRVPGRSLDRGYVVPQASDLAVAGDARWGSRPMAEHRVMSRVLLSNSHYRSRRRNDSQLHHKHAQVPPASCSFFGNLLMIPATGQQTIVPFRLTCRLYGSRPASVSLLWKGLPNSSPWRSLPDLETSAEVFGLHPSGRPVDRLAIQLGSGQRFWPATPWIRPGLALPTLPVPRR